MLECLIVGDSIAVGTAHERPECVSLSQGGINSHDWNKRNSGNSVTARTVIISLGSNDYKGINTEAELKKLRELTRADRVFWILPAIKPHIQSIVKDIAQQHGDTVVPITALQKDGVHPSTAGYRAIKEATR